MKNQNKEEPIDTALADALEILKFAFLFPWKLSHRLCTPNKRVMFEKME
jgi:hypothetical protein